MRESDTQGVSDSERATLRGRVRESDTQGASESERATLRGRVTVREQHSGGE